MRELNVPAYLSRSENVLLAKSFSHPSVYFCERK
jgi:hypothetical protein